MQKELVITPRVAPITGKPDVATEHHGMVDGVLKGVGQVRGLCSKLLIAQVLGRGLRRPDGWQGEDPIVTVFNHDAWSGRIKHLARLSYLWIAF